MAEVLAAPASQERATRERTAMISAMMKSQIAARRTTHQAMPASIMGLPVRR
jgi:hypothetical protein